MINEREAERAFRQEFRDLMPHVIWQSDDGVYQVFGRYRIQPEAQGWRVFCSATDVGVFATTRTALSWCIADKNCAYNTAQELLTTDNKLAALTADIDTWPTQQNKPLRYLKAILETRSNLTSCLRRRHKACSSVCVV